MPELRNTQSMLEEAEHAARAGDFASADRLLRTIARIQEAELGPVHPELANTLNNLAIVAERGGRPNDAEKFYRKSAAIASASLPADHPMVVTSRQNLEAFRRARDASMDTPAMNVSTKDADLGLDVFAREDAGGGSKPPAGKPAADPAPPAKPAAPPTPKATVPPIPKPTVPPTPKPTVPPTAKATVPPTPKATVSLADTPLSVPRPPTPSAPSGASRSRAWVVIAVVVGVTVGVLATRPGLLRDALMLASTATTTTPEAGEPAAPSSEAPAAVPAPTGQTQPSQPAPQNENREILAAPPSAPATSSDGTISLAAAELCRSLSTGSWRCDPAGDSVAPGPLVLYTRVRSPRGASVVHQWYHEGTLRKSVPLTVRANATEGFRTYSRLTVADAGDWRVEVRTSDGDLLHEQRFSVR